jgi:glucose-6-phosphate 1-dehydrogenase
MSNRLVLCIQPDEGIQIRFEAKVPDTLAEMRSVDMVFDYDTSFGKSILPDAYERLLMDILQGDASLFTRHDAIELAWKFIDPIQTGWESEFAPHLEIYEVGSWGPPQASGFIARDGRQWLHGC